MLDPKFFDDLAERLNSAVPTGLKTLQQDLDRNVKAAVQAALNRLDLVTREEFDVQAKVLARTRAKLDDMAERIAVLEAKVLGIKAPAKAPRTRKSARDTGDSDMDGG